jgi:hypothetical protein
MPHSDPGTARTSSVAKLAAGTIGWTAVLSSTGAGGASVGLSPNVAPGGNFDLSRWELQEPIGSPGVPVTISPARLEGPNGFHDSYFFTDPTDGSMTFWDPESGVTTPHSRYPRCELREMTVTGLPADWPTAGTHTLSATLKATRVPDHVAVGQIHVGTGLPASTKPLLEIFYYANGTIVVGIEQSPAGQSEVLNTVGNAPLGTPWSYDIRLTGNTIRVTIQGGPPHTFAMAPAFGHENMYFKAGDYDQSAGSDPGVGAAVQFYALRVVHDR